MGLWVQTPECPEGETVLWRKNANRNQGAVRSVGGRLFLTEQHLLFQPNIIDRLTGGQAWSVALAEVRRLGVTGRNTAEFISGGLRARLSITSTSSEELFVVNDLRGCLQRLANATNAMPDGQSSDGDGWVCWRR